MGGAISRKLRYDMGMATWRTDSGPKTLESAVRWALRMMRDSQLRGGAVLRGDGLEAALEPYLMAVESRGATVDQVIAAARRYVCEEVVLPTASEFARACVQRRRMLSPEDVEW